MVSNKQCAYLCFAHERVRNGYCTDDGRCVCGMELENLKQSSSKRNNPNTNDIESSIMSTQNSYKNKRFFL